MKMTTTTFKSSQDDSVNFITKAQLGYFEARYVRRVQEYFSLYLSSQSGCSMGCRMCHLTATKQTKHVNADYADYVLQAEEVFRYYDSLNDPARSVHFDFMARGEALANEELLQDAHEILRMLGDKARQRNLISRFLISTIMPNSISGYNLARTFPVIAPEIYYSVYSTDEKFRKKWLPQAMPVEEALHKLKAYQDLKRVLVKLHWAVIQGENDSLFDLNQIIKAVRKSGLRADFSFVQYNPYNAEYGEPANPEIVRDYAEYLQLAMPESTVKIIRRVGFDVKASCGMFVNREGEIC